MILAEEFDILLSVDIFVLIVLVLLHGIKVYHEVKVLFHVNIVDDVVSAVTNAREKYSFFT